ncbi:TPA_exp: putative Proline permease [Trichophyton benhamiae CBS 112371]|nr:TPA_exp: putative Proline permease [Trichophyton benhamiae CBS 112371]
MDEKTDMAPAYDNGPHKAVDVKNAAYGEAADLYGDAEAAERYGYVARGLKSRHIQFIALGGTIGTGLFLGIGRALTQGGPLSLLIGYTFVGLAIFAMMMSLGEMATWLPLPGAIPQFCARYVDASVGFAVGWNLWYQCSITLCVEISAAAVIIQYWPGAQDVNVAAWIGLVIAIIVFLNVWAVSVYGEAEFIFASIKIITIVGLLLLALIIDLGGSPTGDRIGFRYWKNPGAMNQYFGTGDKGRFLGFFSTLVNAAFSFGGVEAVACAAGEAENPRKNIPKAVKRVFWRILFFYVLGALFLGMLVPYNDKNLLTAQKNNEPGAAASPWVIAIRRASIPVLPSIINAVILTSATSSGNAFLYTGSRYLYGLAQNRQAPRFLLHCTKQGVPIYAVGVTASISLLTFMAATTGSAQVFIWFQNLTTVASLFNWVSVLVAYIRFHAALKAQGVDRNTLLLKSPFQPYLAWVALIFFSIIIFFNGFDTFKPFRFQSFFTAYIGIALYFALLIFWKVFKRTRWIPSAEADIFTGKAAMDAVEWPEQIPRNIFEKIWFWIA